MLLKTLIHELIFWTLEYYKIVINLHKPLASDRHKNRIISTQNQLKETSEILPNSVTNHNLNVDFFRDLFFAINTCQVSYLIVSYIPFNLVREVGR